MCDNLNLHKGKLGNPGLTNEETSPEFKLCKDFPQSDSEDKGYHTLT